MKVQSLLNELRKLGVQLQLIESQLKINAPAGVLTPAYIAQIKENRAEIIAYLQNLNKESYRSIPRINEQESYPLSNSQKRLWVLSQMEGQSAAYNIPLVYRLRGTLDIHALTATFRRLAERHESMRTVFVLRDGEPRQCILPAQQSGVELVIRTASAEQATTHIKEFVQLPFNLEKGPLFRAELLQIADEEYVLVCSIHHIISDEWSMQVMVRELIETYNALSAGNQPELPPLNIQYKDYAAWQQELLKQQFSGHRQYWLSKFSGELPLLDLPADRSRPPVQQHRGSQLQYQFSTAQSAAFQKLLQEQQVTLFMGVMALVNVLLYRYSGQSDIIIGTPVAGREHPDLEDQIGYYLNTLALRNQMNGEYSFVQVLEHIRQTTVDAFSHQAYPFDLLIEELVLDTDLSRSPLFDVVVIVQNIQLNGNSQLEMRNVEVVPEPSILEISKSDLRFLFSIDEESGILSGNIEYNTDLYDRERIERMSRHFCQLMDSVNENPHVAVNDIKYLSPNENGDDTWFNTALPKPSQPLLHNVIEERVRQYPTQTAVEGYGMSLTYNELNIRANQVAHALINLGLQPQTPVGVYAGGGPMQVVCLLAIFKAAGIYVPMSPDQAINRLEQMISETGMSIIITTTEHQSSLEQLLKEKSNTLLIVDGHFKVRQRGEAVIPDSENNPGLVFPEDSPAYIFYTSGSTGNSKGIIGSHESLSHYIHWHIKEWAVDTNFRISQLAPMTFDASLKDILTALASGATVCMPESNIKNNPARLVEWLQSSNITMLQTVPSIFRLITAALSDVPLTLTALRFVVLAGERLYGRDVTMWKEASGTTARLSNLYGLTETTILKTCYHIPYRDWQPGEVIPVGSPISNTLVAVINNDSLCLNEEMGEVYIKSPFISKGYLDTNLNEKVLVQNPLHSDNDLVWRTGDLGRYRTDNTLEILGRRDEQIKINGVRIELEQVRKAILQQEGITRTELLVHTGEDFRQELICYYTGTRYTAGQIRQFLSDDLNPAMLPSYYVWMDAFPLNMNGKVDRKALPKPEEIRLQAGYNAPHAGIEQHVALLWQQVLKIDRIGRDDNFFNVGGSSLKAIQMIARIYKELDVQLTIAELFANPLLSQLSELIGKSKQETFRPIPKVDEQETYPLSNSQKRLWVLSQMEGQSEAYNIPLLYKMRGALNIEALKGAFHRLVERHESIRTIFVLRDGEPRQYILPADQSGIELVVWDFRTEPSEAHAGYAYTHAEQLIRLPFDLQQGPLFRIELLQVAAQEYLLVCSIHHIISDEWSMQVMVRELIETYNALSSGNQPGLSPLNIQYKDFAAWQQELIKEQFTGHRQYWLSKFSGELPILDLPADRSRPLVQQHRGSHLQYQFSADQSATFQKLLKEQQATLFMGVMALVNILLARYSGQQDLIIGTPVAGREHPDLENQIGYYLNTLALRNQINGEDSFLQVLEHIRQTTVDAFSYQLYPFDLLIEELGLGTDSGRSPLFDVVVILQNIQLNNDLQLEMKGIEVEQEASMLEISKSDLRFQFFVDEKSGILFVNVEYNTDLYDGERIERMSRHLGQLMEVINENPNITVNSIEYISADEKRDSSWFNTTLAKPSLPLLHTVIEERVRQYPTLTAVEGYGMTFTYSDLNTYANQLAHALLSAGAKTVGIYAAGGPMQVICLLAALKAGAVYVPMSPDQAVNRLEQMISETDMNIIITTSEYQSSICTLLKENESEVSRLVVLYTPVNGHLPLSISLCNGTAAGTASFSNTNPDIVLAEDSPAYIFYTSGSTGNSKGIVGSHIALSHYIHWHKKEWNVDTDTRISQLAPMTFDASLKDILTALASGATLCIPENSIKNNPALLAEWLHSNNITLLQTVPSVFRLITAALLDTPVALPALRFVVLAGERLYGRDVTMWKEANGTSTQLSNLYGLTETTILKTCYHIPYQDWQPGEVIPVGFPISNTLVAVINNNNICEDGEMGEVYIKSPFISKGYLDTTLNEQSLVQNPLQGDNEDLVWRTGDLGRYRRDNNLEILGRRDEQIKINGVRIEPEQVRTAILQQEGIIRTELIVHTGEDFRQELICYYTGARYTAEQLRAALADDLNPAMLPSYYMWMDAFPLNMNGKVDRKALPKPEEILLQASYNAPLPGIEQQVALLWQQVLNLDRIGRDDNFFNVGGSSLKAIQMIAKIYRELDVQLTIAELFANPLLSQLSDLISKAKREAYRPIPKVAEQESYPLSNSQKRLWVLSQLDKNSIAYNIPAIYKIRGALNKTALAESFRRLAERHESIRTVFIQQRGEPRQYILPADRSGIELVIRDFSKIADITPHEYAQQVVQLPFDLEQGPLFRVELLQLTDDEYLLVCSIHHIISDDWSMQVMVRELIVLYNALSAQQEPDLAPLSIQYRDYASWQQEQINPGHRQYWLSKFSGELPVLELPADRNRPLVQQHHGSHLEYQFSKEQSSAFQQLLQAQQATLFMGVTALVNVLLFRYSGQSDLITGTPIAGREHPDLENQIGYYLNALALRNHISSEDSFVQVLANIRQTTVEAFSNQSYPFDLLVEELGLGSDLSRSPLFDVVVILQNIQLNNDRQLEMKGVEVEPEPSKLEISKSDLRFQFSFDEQSGILFGNIEYNTGLYDRERIERMSRHLGLLMDSINETPGITVNNIEYLSADERSDKDWFNTILPKPAFPLLHTVIEENVKQYKTLTAVEGYDIHLTYEELNVYANKLAHALLSLGIKSAGVYGTGGPLQVISLLAALKAGVVYIPMSPEQAKNQLGQMISETGMNIVITTSEHQSSLEKLLQEKDGDVSTLLILDKTEFRVSQYDGTGFKTVNTASFSETNPGLAFTGDTSAYIFYTSGSTGNSKGIIGSHIALSHYIHWHKKEWAVEAGMRISQLAPMTFDASLKDILTALASGATLCMPESSTKNNPARLAEWLQSNNINILQTVPSVFRLITAALLSTPIALPALRFVVLAGERLYGRDVTMWKEANGTAARLSNLYGLTETTILKTCYHIPHWDWQPGEVIPVGLPVSNTRVAVINHNNLCQEGEMGEVYIKSPFISKGYLNKDLNEQFLVQNPLHNDNRDLVWRTGDLGRYRSDNSLEILGRRDEQIKINGVRIELEQVRKAILEKESITRTELLVHTGEDFRQELICYYTGNRYTADQLRASLSDDLNPAMIPSYYVWMDSFPLNMNGKVDRKALPRPEEILLQAGYTAPHAGLEQQVALLWQQVLGVDRIGRDDNFFNLGGSSLKAIQLIAKMYKELDVQLTIAELFANPLLSQLSKLIENTKRETYRPIPAIAEQESYPLSNSQKRLWVLSQLEEQSLAYNIPILYRLRGVLNTIALKEAFRLLIARHESIRTVFVLREGEPRQRITEQSEIELIVHDFRIMPSQAKTYAEQLTHMPFDLEQGPLFRIELLRLADEEYLLVGSIHHIISDEWSMQIMFRELISLYNALSTGEQPQLPELPVQYRDYAVWQQEQATGQHRQYWLSRFSGELPVLELPADRNRPPVQQHRGSQLRFQFSAEQSTAFRQLLQERQATLFMGVTALVNVLLCRYSGQSDLIIGTPVAGREHPDLEDQIGYYLNTLALRNKIHDEDSFIQVLEQVRHTTVDAFSHQSYPFDLLVEELRLGSDLSRSPLFDVVVILQNVQVNNDSQLEMNGIEVEQEPATLEISKSDLRFQFSLDERSGILFGNIEYNTDLYDRERIERMSLHLRQLMEAINGNPYITLYQVQDLITSEKQNSIKRALTFNSKIEED